MNVYTKGFYGLYFTAFRMNTKSCELLPPIIQTQMGQYELTLFPSVLTFL